jgi:hypothetical protein
VADVFLRAPIVIASDVAPSAIGEFSIWYGEVAAKLLEAAFHSG